MATPMALIYKVLFPSIATFDTPPDFDLDVVEPFNQVLDLVLHRYLDTVNTVQELENPP